MTSAAAAQHPRSRAAHEIGVIMPKYMDVHSGFVGVTADQLLEAHHRDLAVEGE